MQDIAGVGLAFTRPNPMYPGRAMTGWYVMVWRSDGRLEATGIAYNRMDFPRKVPGRFRKRTTSAADFGPVAQTDPGQLASTHAAWVARDLYQRVLARQGPDGHLAAGRRQKRVPVPGAWDSGPLFGCWSPDGEIGHAGGHSPRPDAP